MKKTVHNERCFLVYIIFFILMSPVIANAAWDFSEAKSIPWQTSKMTLFENVKISGVPYWITMNFTNGKMTPVYKEKIKTVSIPFKTMDVDGKKTDWIGITPVVTDPSGDVNPESSIVPWEDLKSLFMARDDTYIYFLMTVYDANESLPDVNTIYVVEFQQYLHQLHTPGDIGVTVGYHGNMNEWNATVFDRGPGGVVVDSYPSEYIKIGKGMIEWKVPLSAFQYCPLPYWNPSPSQQGIQNHFIRVYIHPGPHPDPPPVSDDNNCLKRPMIVNFYAE